MIIKLCGMREPKNIRAAEAAGTDWMGFILWNRSPRYLNQVPSYLPGCPRVGVFVNPEEDEVLRWSTLMRLDFVQLHGNESPLKCERIHKISGLPIIKAIPVRDAEDLTAAAEYGMGSGVAYLLFDTKCNERGGSGIQFEWEVLKTYYGKRPYLLSGGIGPGDAERIRSLNLPKMAGIDLNSRFETAPGVKDIKLVETFIKQIRQQTEL